MEVRKNLCKILSVTLLSIILATTLYLCHILASTKHDAPQHKSAECKPLREHNYAISPSDSVLSDVLLKGQERMSNQYETESKIIRNKDAATFILGNIGSGKTTVTQILAGNLHHLHATKNNSGDFVIIDDFGRIGVPTTRPKTVLPEYVVSLDYGVAFWDCPGFDDTREPEQDVAAMYFLRSALSMNKFAKFLLTVSYSSLSSVHDQRDMDMLVTHAVRMIKDMNKMSKFIGLVVTNVPGYETTSGMDISDEVILSQIVEFLNIYVNSKEDELKTIRGYFQRNELQKRVDFVRLLLGENEIDVGSPRVYFIRRLHKCGALGNMDSILDQRRKLINWYVSKLEFSPVNLEDFHFLLKSETLDKVKAIFLPEHVNKIADLIPQAFLDIERDFRQAFHKKYNEEHHGLGYLIIVNDSLSGLLETQNRPQKLSYEMKKLLDTLPLKPSCAKVLQVQNFENQLEFLNMATSFESQASELGKIWLNSAQHMMDYLQDLKAITLFSSFWSAGILFTYPKQKILTNLVNSNKQQLETENMLEFLNENGLKYFSMSPTIWSKVRPEDKVFFANEFSKRITKTDFVCKTSSTNAKKLQLLASGTILMLSNVLDSKQWPSECTRENVNEILIVAMIKVFVDIELYSGGNAFHVYIIAPERIIINGTESSESYNVFRSGNIRDAMVEIGHSYGESKGNGKSLSPSENTDIAQRLVAEYRKIFFSLDLQIMNRFLEEIDADPKVNGMLTPLAFAKELVAFEEKYYLGNNPNVSPNRIQSYYQNFLKRLDAYSNSIAATKRKNEETAFLNLIRSTVLGKLAALQRSSAKFKVIKTNEYFATLSSHLSTLKETRKEKAIHQESESYKEALNAKVNEATSFIINTVNPAINNAKMALEKTNSKLEDELKEFLRTAKNDVELAERAKAQYRAYMPLRIGLDVVNFAGTVCSFFGPAASVVGGVISSAASKIKEFVPGESGDSKSPSLALPESFQKSLSNLNNKNYEKKIQEIDKQTDLWEKAAAEIDEDTLHDLKEKVEKRNRTVEEFKKAVANGLEKRNPIHVAKLEQEMKLADKEFKEAVAKKADASKNYDLAKNDAKMSKAKAEKKKQKNEKILKKLDMAFATLDAAVDLGMNIMEEVKGLDRVDAVIKDSEKNVRIVEAKKAQFFNEFLPQLGTIENDITKATSNLSGESQAALSVKRWNVKGMIKKMRIRVREFASWMKSVEEFQLAFDTIDEAFTLMMDLYEHIERYEEKKQLADFIAKATAANTELSEVKDDGLRETISKLNFYIHSNLFLEEYKYSLYAFKQWVFPFASHYLNDRNIGKRTAIPTDIDQVLGFYMKEVEFLRTELERYKATTVNGDKYLMRLIFTSDAVSSEPFYVWENGKWQNSICDLLSGNRVHLMADVDMRGHPAAEFFAKKFAIKYKTIELSLKVNDESRQRKLNEKLNHFYMNMTHSGISVYKAMGQHFVMFDSSQSYHYSFERIGNNQRVSVSMSKYKVDGPDVDFLMSPYTWWTFQLFDVKSGGVGFPDLQEFCEEVDLHLEGEGVYLDEKHTPESVLNNLNLEQHYELYDPEDSDFERDGSDDWQSCKALK